MSRHSKSEVVFANAIQATLNRVAANQGAYTDFRATQDFVVGSIQTSRYPKGSDLGDFILRVKTDDKLQLNLVEGKGKHFPHAESGRKPLGFTFDSIENSKFDKAISCGWLVSTKPADGQDQVIHHLQDTNRLLREAIARKSTELDVLQHQLNQAKDTTSLYRDSIAQVRSDLIELFSLDPATSDPIDQITRNLILKKERDELE